MQRKQMIIVLGLALLFGAGAGFVVLEYLRTPMESVAAETSQTRPVVVAARDLAAGTILQPLDVKVVAWPADLAPAAYASDESAVLGRAIVTHVSADEPFLEAKLAQRGQGGGLPVVIPDGMRAVSVKVDEVIGVAGFVLPGTRVDVLATFDVGGDREDAVTRVILQNVEAIAAGQTTQPDAQGKPQTVPVITLLVSPEEAEDLTLAATQGQIQLALRGTLDQESIRTDGSRVGGLVRGAQPEPARRAASGSRSTSSSQRVITYNGAEKTVAELMRFRILDPLRNERGATIVLVSLMMAALMGMAALAIDVGMLYNARAEAQRAADSAALAGAGSLLVAPDEERARSIAIEFGTENNVQGVPVDLLDEDVEVDVNAMTVGVTVRRAASRGNAMTTWFARVFGVDEVDVAARAAAAVGSTNAATCLKPWIVPDAWDDIDMNNRFDAGVDYYEPGVTSYGSNYRDGVPASNGIDPPGTSYVADFGRPILLKSGDPKKAPQPGWYYPWDIPQADGGPAVGGDRYRWNIANCNPTLVTLGEQYMIENGNMIGPTRQGMDELIAEDPGAYWDLAGDSVAMSAAPAWEGSPRIVYMPLYDPREEIGPGKKPVTLTNVTAFFIEEMRGNEVFGRFLYPSGVPGGIEVSGGAALKYVHLIE